MLRKETLAEIWDKEVTLLVELKASCPHHLGKGKTQFQATVHALDKVGAHVDWVIIHHTYFDQQADPQTLVFLIVPLKVVTNLLRKNDGGDICLRFSLGLDDDSCVPTSLSFQSGSNLETLVQGALSSTIFPRRIDLDAVHRLVCNASAAKRIEFHARDVLRKCLYSEDVDVWHGSKNRVISAASRALTWVMSEYRFFHLVQLLVEVCVPPLCFRILCNMLLFSSPPPPLRILFLISGCFAHYVPPFSLHGSPSLSAIFL